MFTRAFFWHAVIFCSVLDLFAITRRTTGYTWLPDFGGPQGITAVQMSCFLVVKTFPAPQHGAILYEMLTSVLTCPFL